MHAETRTAVRYDCKDRGCRRLGRAEQLDLAFRSLLPPGLSSAEVAARLFVAGGPWKRMPL
jgi:hypothetical protein